MNSALARFVLLLACCLQINADGKVPKVFSKTTGAGGETKKLCGRSSGLFNRTQKLCELMEQSALALLSEKYHRRCSNFISKEGELGEWGLLVLDAIEEVDPSCFYERMDVTKICPKFQSMRLADKAKFWVWVFASISQIESSCRERIKAWGVNGMADGLMQLEYSYALRRSSGRDKEFCKTGGPTDSSTPSFQFKCSASIFRDFHCKRGRPLSSRAGYWEELRGGQRKISRLIKQFPNCQ